MNGDQYIVQSLLKPNWSDKMLFETALNNSKDFGDIGIVILLANRCHKGLIRDFYMEPGTFSRNIHSGTEPMSYFRIQFYCLQILS